MGRIAVVLQVEALLRRGQVEQCGLRLDPVRAQDMVAVARHGDQGKDRDDQQRHHQLDQRPSCGADLHVRRLPCVLCDPARCASQSVPRWRQKVRTGGPVPLSTQSSWLARQSVTSVAGPTT